MREEVAEKNIGEHHSDEGNEIFEEGYKLDFDPNAIHTDCLTCSVVAVPLVSSLFQYVVWHP
jgi:hypothetical protein